MSELIGITDILVGLAILYANLLNRHLIQFPSSHKVGLWLVAVGMIYHGCRNIAPNHFLYGSLMIEISHIGLWIIVGSVAMSNWKRHKTALK